MARKKKLTPKKRSRSSADWRSAFLASLKETGNVRASCEAAGVERTTVYDRRDGDPEFAAAWKEAMDDAIDLLVTAARQRATATSDTLLIFLLKSHRREVYGDQSRHDHRIAGLEEFLARLPPELADLTRRALAAPLSPGGREVPGG